jgi:hypothetical protein
MSAPVSERSSSSRSGACGSSSARLRDAGRHRRHARPGGAGARDVVLGVADHEAARGRHAVALGPRARPRRAPGRCDPPPPRRTRRRRSARDPEALELDARHLRHVSGEKAGDPVAFRADPIEQRHDPGKQPPARRPERHAHGVEHAIPEARLLAVRELGRCLARMSSG